MMRIWPTRTAFVMLCWCVGFLALFGLGYIGFLLSNSVYHDGDGNSSPQLNTETNLSSPALSEPSFAPTPIQGKDSVSVKQAMTNCDEEAARNPNGLYFLVAPVIPVSFESATLLISPGEDYGTFLLIPSHELISGLEDNSLQLSARNYEFSVLNADTSQIQKWASQTAHRSSRSSIHSDFQNSILVYFLETKAGYGRINMPGKKEFAIG